MAASTLKPQLRHALLNNLNAKQGNKKNWIERGFTLVELMIVIVIVGILSAVALPNFLSQTSKAKATEAKTLGASALKEAQVAWTESGSDGLNAWEVDSAAATAPGQCPATTNTFSFACDGATPTAVTVTANGLTSSGDLSGKTVVGSVDVTKGGRVTFCGTAPGLSAC